jgi:hypothetical protein
MLYQNHVPINRKNNPFSAFFQREHLASCLHPLPSSHVCGGFIYATLVMSLPLLVAVPPTAMRVCR